MKKSVFSMVFALTAALAATAAVDDMRLTFCTKGPDAYADGTTVRDGEFYAIVWVVEGAEFRGFNADGTLVAKEGNELVAAVPFAENGHLAFCKKQISAADMRRYEGGVFELVMLDTRNAAGAVSAAKRIGDTGAWELSAVNGYQPIASVSPRAAFLSAALDIASPIRISIASEIPEGTPMPVIVGTAMREGRSGREMVIRVKGTAEYLRYTAAAVGAEGGTASVEATAADGASDPNAEIEIVVPATGDSGIFQIIRK